MKIVPILFTGCLVMACGEVPGPPLECSAGQTNHEIAFRVNGYPVYMNLFRSQLDPIEAELEGPRREAIEAECVDEGTRAECIARIDAEIEAYLREYAVEHRDELAILELIYQHALSEGHGPQTPEDEIRLQSELTVRQETIEAWVTAIRAPEPTEEELRAWYDQSAPSDTLVDIRMLTVGDGELANDLRTMVEDGEANFEELVAEHSIDAFAEIGGRIHYEELVPLSRIDESTPIMMDFEAVFADQQAGFIEGPRTNGSSEDEGISFSLFYLASREFYEPPLEELGEQAIDGARNMRIHRVTDELRTSIQYSDDSTRVLAPTTAPITSEEGP